MSKKTKKSAKKEADPVYTYYYETSAPEETPNKYLQLAKESFGVAALTSSAFLILFAIFARSGPKVIKPTTDRDMAFATVMITRPDHQSGGTGVILQSTPSRSYVLTNSHVCGVVEKGGVVISDQERENAVVGYVKSKDHDLCMIEVAADLHVNTALASNAPDVYDAASISGHPALLPTVVTRGHFSGHKIISVFTGIKPCTEDDFAKNPLQCLFFGGIPQVKSYEAQLVTATIQGGSSGSAVYNEKGEISGLVFAGSGPIGYAFIVPYEAVYNFVNREFPLSSLKKPSDGLSGNDSSEDKAEESKRALINKCQTDPLAVKEDKLADVCSVIISDMIFNGRGIK